MLNNMSGANSAVHSLDEDTLGTMKRIHKMPTWLAPILMGIYFDLKSEVMKLGQDSRVIVCWPFIRRGCITLFRLIIGSAPTRGTIAR